MSNCSNVVISDPILVVEIPNSPSLIVEIESETLGVEIQSCKENVVVEIVDEKFVAEIPQYNNLIIEIDQPTLLVEFPDSVVINNPDLPPSNDITSIVCLMECGAQVNINRVVSVQSDGRVIHSDKDDFELSKDSIGITRQSGATGQFVEVVKFGKVYGASFGAIGENFFLGNDGKLISTPSQTGTWLPIGVQVAASEFNVNIGEPIRRN